MTVDAAVVVLIVAGVIALFALAYLLVRALHGGGGGEPIPGPPGPTAVSSDPDNYARLGSDELIFVPIPPDPGGDGGDDPERPPDTFVLTDFGGRPWDPNFDNADAIDRMLDAAPRGGEFFLPGEFWTSRPLVPQSNSIFRSLRPPKYAWDSEEHGPGLRARSDFDGPALVWNRDMARGVSLRHMGLFGPSEAGDVDGIDFGVSSGPERSWVVENGTIMYCGVALTGYMWACTVRSNHIARNAWAVAPHLANDGQGCRANDCIFDSNYVYFNHEGGLWFGGDVESGLTTISGGRVERSGTSMDPMDPNVNRNPTAPGILLTKATKMVISHITTDANAGPGLILDAASPGQVNNVSVHGFFNRDGTYKNREGERMPAIVLRKAVHVTLNGPMIGFGDPDDKGSGVIAPQIGYEFDGTEFVDGHGRVQLANNSTTAEHGVLDHGNNWQRTATISGWT